MRENNYEHRIVPLQIIFMILKKNLYLEYIKNSKNEYETKQSNRKMAKRFEHFTEENNRWQINT